MKELPNEVKIFFSKQTSVIIATIDESGSIHCSVKGIIDVDPKGKIYLVDIYRAHTFSNLARDKTVSLTAVDEHQFIGWTLKGNALIVERKDMPEDIMKKWEDKVIERISQRVIKNVKNDYNPKHHPEAKFPYPQYLIDVEVEQIVDLTPPLLKKKNTTDA